MASKRTEKLTTITQRRHLEPTRDGRRRRELTKELAHVRGVLDSERAEARYLRRLVQQAEEGANVAKSSAKLAREGESQQMRRADNAERMVVSLQGQLRSAQEEARAAEAADDFRARRIAELQSELARTEVLLRVMTDREADASPPGTGASTRGGMQAQVAAMRKPPLGEVPRWARQQSLQRNEGNLSPGSQVSFAPCSPSDHLDGCSSDQGAAPEQFQGQENTQVDRRLPGRPVGKPTGEFCLLESDYIPDARATELPSEAVVRRARANGKRVRWSGILHKWLEDVGY